MNQKNEEIDGIEEADLELTDDMSDDFESEEIEETNYDLSDSGIEKPSGEPEATRALVFPLTQTQYEVVIMAIQHVKDQFDYPIGDGQAATLICGDYLAGVEHE